MKAVCVVKGVCVQGGVVDTPLYPEADISPSDPEADTPLDPEEDKIF